MNRLTVTVKLPPEGVFRVFSDEEREQIKCADKVSQKEIYRRLQEYENVGLTPDEIEMLKAHNSRLHKLLDDVESVLKG